MLAVTPSRNLASHAVVANDSSLLYGDIIPNTAPGNAFRPIICNPFKTIGPTFSYFFLVFSNWPFYTQLALTPRYIDW